MTKFLSDIETDVPSAFQVRIAGCKGMLMIDPESKKSDYYIKVRKSMEKFKGNEWSLYVVDHSRPSNIHVTSRKHIVYKPYLPFLVFKCHLV